MGSLPLDEYRGQTPKWQAELLRRLAVEQERVKSEVVIVWPESSEDVSSMV
jgi:hypothetical protein